MFFLPKTKKKKSTHNIVSYLFPYASEFGTQYHNSLGIVAVLFVSGLLVNTFKSQKYFQYFAFLVL